MATDEKAHDSYRALDLRTALLAAAVLILGGWALRALAPVLMPLVAAILIALAVMPVRDWVQDRLPDRLRPLGIAAAMSLILLILCLFFGGIWIVAQQVVNKVPAPSSEFEVSKILQGGAREGRGQFLPETSAGEDKSSKADASAQQSRTGGAEGSSQSDTPGAGAGAAAGQTQGHTGQDSNTGSDRSLLSSGSVGEVLSTLGDQTLGAVGNIATTILNSILGLVAGLVLIFFFTLLLLIESPDWKRKTKAITWSRAEWRLTESASVIARKVRRYLVLRTILGVVTAALYALWLWFFGVGLVLVWALLTFLLNFVPTIGSLIAGLLPVAYVLLTQSWGTALGVAAGLLVIEQVMGNYVDPRFQGKNISLSPLVILVALVFWGWLWGIAGVLLAVPVTVSLVVLFAHIPVLKSWALLLSNRTDMEGLDQTTRPS